MTYGLHLKGDEAARQALALFHVLDEETWFDGLLASYLTAEQKAHARETIFETLLCLADYGLRWNWSEDTAGKERDVRNSLDYLERALAFHQPTRGLYWVRVRAHGALKDEAAAERDRLAYEAAVATTPLDHYLPGHTAGCEGDRIAANAAYRAALKLQPDHYNSLYFLANRLAADLRFGEAIGCFTGCIALRPEHVWAYLDRGAARERVQDMTGAEEDYLAASAAGTTLHDRLSAHQKLADYYLKTHQIEKERAARTRLETVISELLARLTSSGERRDGETDSSQRDLVATLRSAGVESRATSLLETALRAAKDVLGPNDPMIAGIRRELGVIYLEAGSPERAAPPLAEAVALFKAALGPDDSYTQEAMAHFGQCLVQLKRFAEAEPHLRECAAASVKTQNDGWRKFNAKSRLGAALLGQAEDIKAADPVAAQAKLAEAELLLLAGYQGLRDHEENMGPKDRIWLTEALDRLVHLYEILCKSEEAARWRREREETRPATKVSIIR